MYPKTYTRRMDMALTDSVDVEQLNTAVGSMESQYTYSNNLIPITADYDEKYVDRKPKVIRHRPGQLLDSGYKLKKRFTLSDMYVKAYQKKGDLIPFFDYAKGINSSPKKYNYGNKNFNENQSLNDEKSSYNNCLKGHNYGYKKKIKVLYDDVVGNILTTNAYDKKYKIESAEWEPVAYEGLDSLPANMYSTEHRDIPKSTPIFWESLHYDGVDNLAQVLTTNNDINKNNNRVDNINTTTEESLKSQSNEIVVRTDLVTENSTLILEDMSKVNQTESKEEDDDDIEVFKHKFIEKNYTQEMNNVTKSTVELKRVTVEKYDSKDNIDLKNIVLSSLNTTKINNNSEERETEKPSSINSAETSNDYDILEFINPMFNTNQESYRNELKIDLQNNKVEEAIPQSDDELERVDLMDITEEIMQPNKFDTKNISNNVNSNLLISTIVEDPIEKFRPHRTTNNNFYNRIAPVLKDSTTNKNFFRKDYFVSEKSDILFLDLLGNQYDNITGTRKSYISNYIPKLPVNGSRFTDMIKKYSPKQKEKKIVQYLNHADPIKESNDADSIEETPSASVTDDRRVSKLVYKYKQSLRTATKRIETNTESVRKHILPVIDYDYLLYTPIRENTPATEKYLKTTREHFNAINVNPEHDWKFEWNDYNNYDEALSNEESEISKWQKVLPLQLPEKKSTSNFISLYTRLPSLRKQYTHYPKPKRTTYAKPFSTRKFTNTGKRILHLKIRRNTSFPNLQNTKNKPSAFDDGDDMIDMNNWTDDHGTDYYEFLDRPITDPGVLQPREINLSHLDDPYKKQIQVHKRNIKSTLFDELFKTQKFTHLVTLIWHKKMKDHKNMLQRKKYGLQRQKRECVSINATFVNANPFITEKAQQNKSNCGKNIVTVYDDNVTSYEHKTITTTTATLLTKKTDMEATEYPLMKRRNLPMTVDYTENVESEKNYSEVIPLLPKLYVKGNQPMSKHAKYKKKSQVKLGNIWRFMAKSIMIDTELNSYDDNISHTNNHIKVLNAKSEASDDSFNIVEHEPKSILIRTTIDPVPSFTKKTPDERISNDTETVHLNKSGYLVYPIGKLREQKTGRDSIWQNVITIPTAFLEFTQNPTITFFKKIYTAMTPYELAKELTFIENVTDETPWTPFMFKNPELNLKSPFETKFPVLINAIDANDYATKTQGPTTQNFDQKKILRTTEKPLTISLKPASLFDPLPKNYLYFKRVGATMITPAKLTNNKNKQKITLPSLKRNHFSTKSLSSITPSYYIVTDWAKTKTNMINNATEKHYLSFFSKLSKVHNKNNNISNTTQKIPTPSEISNKLFQPKENSKITTKENTGTFELNFLKLHVPSSFTKKYVPITTYIATTSNDLSNGSKFNLLNTANYTIERHSAAIKESSTKRTTETINELITALYSTTTGNYIRKPSMSSNVFRNTLLTIPQKVKQDKANHWLYKYLNKYPVVVPRYGNINLLPITKGVNKESKIYKHWKSDHPPWVLQFWNKLREDHQTLSLFPAKLKYQKLETTTENTVVNFYFKNNINKNTNVPRPSRPTAKVPIPEIKRIRVVPLSKVDNEVLITSESKPTVKSYISTSKVQRRITKEPFLREEARAKQMDDYILLMMKKTTDSPDGESTDWLTFRDDKWPTLMKTTIKNNKTEAHDEFPNYQDLMQNLENEEQELEIKTILKKSRRDADSYKRIIVNRSGTNDDKIGLSAEQKEQNLLDDVDKLLRHYFPS